FNSQNYLNNSNPKALILQHFEPKPNTAINQNFTLVLLAYTQLYYFIYLCLIVLLKVLTLNKLYKILIGFHLYITRVGDIIKLMRYMYLNPDLLDRSNNRTLNNLRILVVKYILYEIDIIRKCDEFVKYIEEGGKFVRDF
ncbi:hypothetical protein P154DRAFT_436377, partial [Amniculicola lignicola CBS 123094]